MRDAAPHAELSNITLATEGFVAVLPRHHAHAAKRRLNARALKDERFVFYPRTAGELAYRRNLRACLDAGFEPRIVQEASNWVTIFHLVGAGVGITIAPASAAEIHNFAAV